MEYKMTNSCNEMIAEGSMEELRAKAEELNLRAEENADLWGWEETVKDQGRICLYDADKWDADDNYDWIDAVIEVA